MLTRVHIDGYQSFHDVEVRLAPLAVMFGPNAAGKSNLLDALQPLAKLGTSRTSGKEESPSPLARADREMVRLDHGVDRRKGFHLQSRAKTGIEK